MSFIENVLSYILNWTIVVFANSMDIMYFIDGDYDMNISVNFQWLKSVYHELTHCAGHAELFTRSILSCIEPRCTHRRTRHKGLIRSTIVIWHTLWISGTVSRFNVCWSEIFVWRSQCCDLWVHRGSCSFSGNIEGGLSTSRASGRRFDARIDSIRGIERESSSSIGRVGTVWIRCYSRTFVWRDRCYDSWLLPSSDSWSGRVRVEWGTSLPCSYSSSCRIGVEWGTSRRFVRCSRISTNRHRLILICRCWYLLWMDFKELIDRLTGLCSQQIWVHTRGIPLRA